MSDVAQSIPQAPPPTALRRDDFVEQENHDLRTDIWRRQYAITPDETLEEGAWRVARHVVPEDPEPYAQLMLDNRFWPGGRVLAGAGTAHGNLLNCFVQDGNPEKPGTTEYALAIAKKLALVTKVGGGNGVNLDPFLPKAGYPPPVGVPAVHISNKHPDADNVRQGRYMDLVRGEYVTKGYRALRWIGVDEPPQSPWTHYIKVGDSIEEIWDAANEMVTRLLKGEDVFIDLSNLRAEGTPVNGSGGTSSGPASFAVEVFDNFAYWAKLGGANFAGPVATLRYLFAPTLRVIRQGGSRRGAGMATLSVEHPDIMDFVTSKDLAREEAEGDIGTFNISVLADDGFMQQTMVPGADAGVLLSDIAHHAWQTGEPGLLYVDTINHHNPLYIVDGPIVATNPCGEIGLYPGEPCDLGAIVLSEHLCLPDDAYELHVDWEKLGETVRLATVFLDRVLDVENSPIPEIHDAIQDKRRTGLGVMGLADMLIKLGVPYDSAKGRKIVSEVIDFIREQATLVSVERGETLGVPDGVARAGFLRRNIALLTVAPTGTTSMLAGVSSGIEPVFAATYTRRIGTDYVEVVHPLLEEILKDLVPSMPFAHEDDTNAWDMDALLKALRRTHGSVRKLIDQGLLYEDEMLKGFLTAHDVSPINHVLMQAAVQQAFDRGGQQLANSISKTINLPHEATVADVLDVYRAAWSERCKGITVYRDGSRQFQVLTVDSDEEETEHPHDLVLDVIEEVRTHPTLRDLEEFFADLQENPLDESLSWGEVKERLEKQPRGVVVRDGVVRGSSYKYELMGRKVYVQVFRNDDGEIVEVWTPPYKGDTSQTKTAHDIIGRLASLALKFGAPVDALEQVFRGHYDASGGIVRKHGYVSSQWELVADSIQRETANGKPVSLPAAQEPVLQVQHGHIEHPCPECGVQLFREEGCWNCHTCGYSKCG